MIPSAVRCPPVTVLTPWRMPTRWWPLRPGVRALARREHHERAARRAQDVRAALRARALLEQDELAALVSSSVGRTVRTWNGKKTSP